LLRETEAARVFSVIGVLRLAPFKSLTERSWWKLQRLLGDALV
jgi:hypothetical protein